MSYDLLINNFIDEINQPPYHVNDEGEKVYLELDSQALLDVLKQKTFFRAINYDKDIIDKFINDSNFRSIILHEIDSINLIELILIMSLNQRLDYLMSKLSGVSIKQKGEK